MDAFRAATGGAPIAGAARERFRSALPACKPRAKSIPQLLEQARFALLERPVLPDEAAAKALDPVSRGILNGLTPQLHNASWERGTLEAAVSAVAEAHGTTLGKLAGPIRAALAGRTVTPSVFDMMLVLGREETLARLGDSLERQG